MKAADWNDVAKTGGSAAVLRAWDGLPAGPPPTDNLYNVQDDNLPAGPPLPLVWFDDIEAQNDADDFVEGLLVGGSLAALVAGTNEGKSFFAVDLGARVALGWSWHGREVERGGVVYVAGEGGTGIRRRLVAFRQHHEITGAVPFALVPTSIDLLDPAADTERLIRAIIDAGKTTGAKMRLVIIDTLSRALAGGDENSSVDMGGLVRNIDRIREATGACLLLVHHLGKDRAKGARGHSLLKAAVDTEIEITVDATTKVRTARVTKQRDLESGAEFAFELEQVEVGQDRRGRPVTSCVAVPADKPDPTPIRDRLSGQNAIAFKLLERAIIDQGAVPPVTKDIPQGGTSLVVPLPVWRGYCERGGLSEGDNPDSFKQAWKRVRKNLLSSGYIGTWDDLVWIARPQGDRGTTGGQRGDMSPGSGGGTGGHPLRGLSPLSPSPSGDRAEALRQQEVHSTQTALTNGLDGLRNFPVFLRECLEQRVWEHDREFAGGTRQGPIQFRDFVTRPYPVGLGSDPQTIRRLIETDSALLALWDAADAGR